MIRTPLRPLARILRARAEGENPDVIEHENIRARHEAMRDRLRARAAGRIVFLALCFCAAFGTIGVRMGILAATEPVEPGMAGMGVEIQAQRADIIDRNGRVLATNMITHALYAHPKDLIDPERTARELARIFPDLKAERLQAAFASGRNFMWLRRTLSPEQRQAVHDIGEPGLLFGPREMRLYPNGAIAAHILGGASFGQEGVQSAEVIGTAGVERVLDQRLRDPAQLGEPLHLSVDLSVQAAVEEVLAGGVRMLNARGAAAIVMDARTGEIIALASLPDFDPNARPLPPASGDPGDSPLFNRAVQGMYELGSVMKVFPIAHALELGFVRPDTVIDTWGPVRIGGVSVRDTPRSHRSLTVSQIISKSSNVGTAKINAELGPERQQAFLKLNGFFAPLPIELTESTTARPIVPSKWRDSTATTVSYGHGLSASPLHLAAAIAAMVNGGTRVTPTLIMRDAPPPVGDRLISPQTSAEMRAMLRETVTDGTARRAEVKGYALGGKTGTAEKPLPTGGYAEDKVVATFAGAFPMSDPRYVIVVSLDEPEETTGDEPRRTAGYTAAPVTAEILRRIGPILGLKPEADPDDAGLAALATVSQ
jgi:cell division protein FtsI (penicillin-binding protein 3)